MFKQVVMQLRLFLLLFRLTPPMTPYALVPGMVLLLSFPILGREMGGDVGFITAFIMTYGARVVLHGGRAIERAYEQTSVRGMSVAVSLLLAVIAVLIWAGSPLWCMRFYTVFMLVSALAYLLDVGGPGYEVTRHFFAHKTFERSYPMLAWVMVIYHVAMALLNESLIATVSRPVWMMFFASLPLIEHVIKSALVLTVLLEREDLR